MTFSVAGIEVSPLVPPLVAFVFAAVCAPVGISGAFILLPFQVSVLGFTSPSVTPTNLLYNIVATPGGVIGYGTKRKLDWGLLRLTLVGTVPGVIAGAFLRTQFLADPERFRAFAGAVLLGLGLKLAWEVARKGSSREDPVPSREPAAAIISVALAVGIVGGIYGIGGGAIIAPVLTSIFHMPLQRVAGVALAGTFVTSAVGIAAFEVLGTASDAAHGPDWLLGLLFGIGGFAGSYAGARLQDRLPPRPLKGLLAVLVLGAGIAYLL